MAAVAFTKVVADPNTLAYTWTGDADGTLAFSTILDDAVPGPLKTALQSVDGECDSHAKAVAALVTGAAFIGLTGAALRSYIQADLVVTSSTTAKAAPALLAEDDGATNDPQATVKVDDAATGVLRFEHKHSFIR